MLPKQTNKKSPQDAVTRGDAEPEYPWVGGVSDVNGRYLMVYADPEHPEKAYVQEFNHDASFKITEVLDDRGMTNSLVHDNRTYGRSHSSHWDGNRDDRSTNNSRVSDKEIGHQAGKWMLAGAASGHIAAYKTSATIVPTGSYNNSYNYTSGDGANVFESNYFAFYQQDYAQHVSGSLYSILQKGEYGIHVQLGNMDIRLDKGKYQVFSQDAMVANTASTMAITATQDITIKSNSKIILEVGSSKITIDTKKITVESDDIDLKAKKAVTTMGEEDGSKIQGGGPIAPPTTFK